MTKCLVLESPWNSDDSQIFREYSVNPCNCYKGIGLRIWGLGVRVLSPAPFSNGLREIAETGINRNGLFTCPETGMKLEWFYFLYFFHRSTKHSVQWYWFNVYESPFMVLLSYLLDSTSQSLPQPSQGILIRFGLVSHSAVQSITGINVMPANFIHKKARNRAKSCLSAPV